MKDITKSTILGSLFYAIWMAVFMNIFMGAEPIFMFFFSFLGFGIFMFLFQLFMLNKNKKIAKEINGKIYYQGPANHFVGVESVGGYLFVTKDKIIFKSHSFNIQNHNIEILQKNIIEVKPYNNLRIFPNGLEVIQKGKTDKFVVNDRMKIMQILNKDRK